MTDTNEKIAQTLQKLILPACGVIVLALVISGVMYFMDKSKSSKLAQSYDQLFLLKKESETLVKAWKPEEAPLDGADKTKKEKPVAKKEVSSEEKKTALAPVIEKLNQHIQANQGTQVAVEAALVVVDLGAEYSDAVVGIEPLKTALKGLSKEHFLFAVGQSELGTLLAKADKCSEATQVWESVIAVKDHAFFANNLRLKAGVCYEKMAMLDKAEKLYQEVLDQSPNSSSARTAKKFLLHIKFVKNKGEADESSKQKNG